MIDKIFSNASSAIINVAALSWIATRVGGLFKWLSNVYLKNYCVGATVHGDYVIENIVSHLTKNTTGRSNRLLVGNRMINTAYDRPKLDYGVFYIKYKKRLILLYSYKATAMNEKGYSQFLAFYIFGRNRKVVLDEILKSARSSEPEAKVTKSYVSTNGYVSYSDIPKDDIKVKVYGENQKKALSYISNWMSSEKIYRDMKRPYKLGMLLYGNPGTGKTSSVECYAKLISDILYKRHKELLGATAIELVVQILKVPSLYDESALDRFRMFINDNNKDIIETREYINNECVDSDNTGPKKLHYTIYVIEEIDRYFYDNNGKEIYFKGESELMNLLDGDSSPDNAVIIMTTNYADRIPKVLLRPGRTDVVIEFKELTKEEAEEMCNDNGCKLSDIYKEEKESYNPAALELDILSYRLGGAFDGSNVGGVGRDVGISKKD